MLFDILTGKVQPDAGTVRWGKTIICSYLPKTTTNSLKIAT